MERTWNKPFLSLPTDSKKCLETDPWRTKIVGNFHKKNISDESTPPFFYHYIILLKRQRKGLQYSLWTEVLPKKVNSPRALKSSTTDAWIGKIWGFKYQDSHYLTYEMTSSKNQTTWAAKSFDILWNPVFLILSIRKVGLSWLSNFRTSFIVSFSLRHVHPPQGFLEISRIDTQFLFLKFRGCTSINSAIALLSTWWLNHPIYKICASQIGFPQGSVWKSKNMWKPKRRGSTVYPSRKFNISPLKSDQNPSRKGESLPFPPFFRGQTVKLQGCNHPYLLMVQKSQTTTWDVL